MLSLTTLYPFTVQEPAISKLSTSAKIAIAVLAGIAGLLVLAVGVSAAFMPGCEWCHARGAFKTQTLASSHAQIACSECHGGTTVQSRLSWGVDQVFGMTLRVKDIDPTVAHASSAQCVSCHDQLKGTTTSGGLRIRHEDCGSTRECSDCHSTVAHGTAVQWPRTVTMDMCYDCHGAKGVPSKCDTCHTARLRSDRVKTGTFKVTHGPDAKKTHGMGNMKSCQQCHEPAKCVKCHGVGLPHPTDFTATHGQISGLPTAKCTTCHEKAFCSDCHKYEMPHPKRFIKVHAAATRRDGQETCARCHAAEDCVQCHTDHVHPVTKDQMEALGRIPAEGDAPAASGQGGDR